MSLFHMHAKITQKSDCKPVLAAVPITAGTSSRCVTRERTKDKDRYEDNMSREGDKALPGNSISNCIYLSQMEGNKRATTVIGYIQPFFPICNK